jgi:glycosyltransferase involved in cell wall biosynthesis
MTQQASMSPADRPFVSVIIPCYNQGAYLKTAVTSVLNQSYPAYEIIVINDGSTCPRTDRLLKEASFPKSAIYHTANQGVAAARNEGISRAKGKYILPLDADDKIGPDYLRQAVAVMEGDGEVGIVYSRAEYMGLLAGPVPLADYSLEQMLYDNVIFCSGLFRHADWKQVGGYKADMKHFMEDYDFWLSIISLGRKVVQLPECHFYYRIKRQSATTKVGPEQYLEMRIKTYMRHRDLYLQHADAVFKRVFEGVRETQLLKYRLATVPTTRIYNIIRREMSRVRRLLKIS